MDLSTLQPLVAPATTLLKIYGVASIVALVLFAIMFVVVAGFIIYTMVGMLKRQAEFRKDFDSKWKR